MVANTQLLAFEDIAVVSELDGIVTFQAAFRLLVATLQPAAGFDVAGDVTATGLQFEQVRLTQKIVGTDASPVNQRLLAGHRSQRGGFALVQGDLAHVGGDVQGSKNRFLVLYALFPEHFDEGARLVAFGFGLCGVHDRAVRALNVVVDLACSNHGVLPYGCLPCYAEGISESGLNCCL